MRRITRRNDIGQLTRDTDFLALYMHTNNIRLASVLKEIGLMYRYLGPEHHFRARAYAGAARTIRLLTMDVAALKGSVMKKHIPGIGAGISRRIEEYLQTGNMRQHSLLKKRVPFELVYLLDVKGWGPATLKQISRQLHINTKEGLVSALLDGRVAGLAGFSEAKAKRLLHAMRVHQSTVDRMLLADALVLGEGLVRWFKQREGVERVEVAGSIRRKERTIGDVDLVVACDDRWRRSIIADFCSQAFAAGVIARGYARASIIHRTSGRQVDILLVKPGEWGAALLHFTGPKEHNIHLRRLAKQAGYKLSEHGLFSRSDGSRLAGDSEESIYYALGLQALPPEQRRGSGELRLLKEAGYPVKEG